MCVRFLDVVQRGGVYFFGASIFHVCLLSGGENEYFFFVIDLFSLYYRFTNLKYLPSGENFCLLNGGENKNLCT